MCTSSGTRASMPSSITPHNRTAAWRLYTQSEEGDPESRKEHDTHLQSLNRFAGMKLDGDGHLSPAGSRRRNSLRNQAFAAPDAPRSTPLFPRRRSIQYRSRVSSDRVQHPDETETYLNSMGISISVVSLRNYPMRRSQAFAKVLDAGFRLPSAAGGCSTR